MRASMAYFAGAGTVIAAIVGGVGGGLLIADMVSPKSPKQGVEQTRLERRTSPAPIPAANAPSEPVQYLAASQPPPSGAAAEPVRAPAQTQADNSASKPPQPVATAAPPPGRGTAIRGGRWRSAGPSVTSTGPTGDVINQDKSRSCRPSMKGSGKRSSRGGSSRRSRKEGQELFVCSGWNEKDQPAPKARAIL